MLEIILLYFLCKSLGNLLRNKGHQPLPYQIMLVVLWFGGEFLGGMVAGAVQVARSGGAPLEPFDVTVYLFAILGAGCGAGIAFLIAKALPSNQEEPSYAGSEGHDYQFPPPDPNNPYAAPYTKR